MCYIPHAAQYGLVVYFMLNNLYLLIPYRSVAPPSSPLPMVNHKLALYVCVSPPFCSVELCVCVCATALLL